MREKRLEMRDFYFDSLAPGQSTTRFWDELRNAIHYHDAALQRAESRARRRGERMTVQAVILAAGMGTRLGRPWPKPLTPLADGRTIMQQQMDNLLAAFDDLRITTVIGFKLELIIEAFPDVSYVYNENYDRTNTNRSLLKALRQSADGGVLWMNGDVVFDPQVLERVKDLIAAEQSFICVNTAVVGDEEVKYTVDADGFVDRLSKTVTDALGESVGINYVSSADKADLIVRLAECDDSRLLRAWPRADDREGQRPGAAVRHPRPLRRRGRLRGGPQPGQPAPLAALGERPQRRTRRDQPLPVVDHPLDPVALHRRPAPVRRVPRAPPGRTSAPTAPPPRATGIRHAAR